MRRPAELEGEEVAVLGPLRRGIGGVCTLLACYTAELMQPRAGGLTYRYRATEPGQPAGPATLADETFDGDRMVFAEGGCCNRCGAGVSLGDSLWLGGPQFHCGGDESLMCCSVDAHGQDVVARGVLRRLGSAFELADAVVCSIDVR